MPSPAVAERALPRRATTAKNRFWIGIEQPRIRIVESVQFDARNLLPDKPFNRGNFLNVFAGHDRKRIADALGIDPEPEMQAAFERWK